MALPPVIELEVEPKRHTTPAVGAALAGLLQIPKPIVQPAGGVDWALTLEGGYYWRVLLASAAFIASATVADRSINWTIQDGDGNVYASISPTGVITATQAVQVSWGAGITTGQTEPARNTSLNIPNLFLPGGWKIGPVTQGLQPGDQWSKIFVLLERVGGRHPPPVLHA